MNARRLALVLVCLAGAGAWSILAGLERAYSDAEPNYALIEDGLYMGGLVRRPPPGTRAVLNLCERANSYGAEQLLWQPIRDAEPAPSIDWLKCMVEFVDAQRQAKRTTYVHCRNGASRSGFVVVAYVMHKHGWTRDQAVKLVRSKRAETRPNPAFMDRLAEWERALALGKS